MIRDLYQEVTDKIVAAIESGTPPWRRSWKGKSNTLNMSLPYRHNFEAYRGINIMLLLMEGRQSPFWFTYRQAALLGAQVRGGEKGTMIVFFKPFESKEKDSNGKPKKVFVLRSYTVFNADQIDNLPVIYTNPTSEVPLPDPYFDKCGADIRYGGNSAFYMPSGDFIQMPMEKDFETKADYWATKAHELVHWTSHETRCNRSLKGRFGDYAYGAEELIAELGAAFIMAKLGLCPPEHQPGHASYLASWLRMMKEDKKAIFKAATDAQAAADFITGKVYTPEAEETATH